MATEPQAWGGTLAELSRLQQEIDDDLTHGRITPEDYDFARRRIEAAVKVATQPVQSGQRIRVTSIPQKEIDTDKLAVAYMLLARAEARRKRAARERGEGASAA
ncbi:hypothetical protein LRS13_12690 [Svornostia abyssi]|uniref:Uncharacterized protein n=1 Tax=Svornostia abyssi TaxID=2898438 RepID=A0ABY5PA44_9ACTN|nr:hypothetical protein LRS13_12690 [Parviterribacteraceae bacterium J379]